MMFSVEVDWVPPDNTTIHEDIEKFAQEHPRIAVLFLGTGSAGHPLVWLSSADHSRLEYAVYDWAGQDILSTADILKNHHMRVRVPILAAQLRAAQDRASHPRNYHG